MFNILQLDQENKDVKTPKRTLKSRPLSRLLLAVLILFILLLGVGYTLSLPPGGTNDVEFVVEPNSSTSVIASQLLDEGLIRSERFFILYTRLAAVDQSLRAGTYHLNGSMGLAEIISELQKGSVRAVSFTVPEGFTIEQVADLFDAKGIVNREDFLQLMKNGDFNSPFLDQPPGGEYSLEGFLFPDTYKITAETTGGEVISLMLDRFNEIYKPEYADRARQLGMTDYEIITLASIIEREAKKPEERPIISAVFHNRLKKGMLLQSCATVQYALGETKPVLYNEDLEVESPYNTYKHQGLPPGPIASPGEAAIKAALYPADVSYLYFVAKKDGSHAFSDTLAEHNAAKRKYLH